jgi:hypothetical protein
MNSLIESLESRTLLSAPPQVAALINQGRVINAEFKAAEAVDAGGVKTIAADLKAAQLAKADKAALRTLERRDAATFKVLGKAIGRSEKAIVKEAGKLVSDGGKLLRKPGNAKLIAAVASLKVVLMAEASADLTVIASDINLVLTTHETNANALLVANPTQTQLRTDVTASDTSLSVALTTLGNDVNVALTTDVNNILALF